MSVFPRLSVLGAAFLITVSTAAQESRTAPAADSKNEGPRGSLSVVTLRPPTQVLTSVPLIRGTSAEQTGRADSWEQKSKGVAISGRTQRTAASQALGARRGGCEACAKSKDAPVRRVLNRLTSGFDYLVFGVTASGHSSHHSTCECDGFRSCDTGYEAVSTESHPHRQPNWGREKYSGARPDELREYFNEQPRRPAFVDSDRIGEGLGDPEGLYSPQRAAGAQISPETRIVPNAAVMAPSVKTREDQELTPAAKLPSRIPVVPLKDLSKPVAGGDPEGQTQEESSWSPPTDPFADDPLPKK